MKDKIREVIEMHDSLVEYKHGKEHCILPEHYDELAGELVKLFAIPVVMQRSELLLFADYSESDKTSQTTDECVDNYLAQKSNSA